MTHHDPLQTLSTRLIDQGLSEPAVFERILS